MALKKYKNFYTGKDEWLTEEEYREGLEGRQAIGELLRKILDHPKHSLIAAWYLIIIKFNIFAKQGRNDFILLLKDSNKVSY